MSKILLIEDNKDILEANGIMLELEGYDVLTAKSIEAGRKLALKAFPDLIILDIMLPDGSGIDLCNELMSAYDFNIIFLSALGEKKDIIKGLKAGSCDYITKPYLMEELLLRVKSVLKHTATSRVENMTYGHLVLKPHAFIAEYNGTDLMLNPKEYAVLDLLCRNSGKYISAETILEKVWNLSDQSVQPVYNCLSSLREKLAGKDVTIDFKRGKGYMARLK